MKVHILWCIKLLEDKPDKLDEYLFVSADICGEVKVSAVNFGAFTKICRA